MSSMFSNIYFERRSGHMHVREIHNDNVIKVNEKINYCYYQEDPKKQSDITDAYGLPVIKKEFDNWRDYRESKENSEYRNLKICETDLSEEVKFLQERYKNVKLNVDMNNVNICYIDIEIAGELEFPEPSEAKYPINLITVIDSKTNQINTWGLNEYTGNLIRSKNFTYHWIPDEKELMTSFVTWFRKQKFDVISGWNCKLFDIHYIVNRNRKLNVDLSLSPFNKEIETIESEEDRQLNIDGSKMPQRSKFFTLPGINILDYMELFKNFTFENQPSYTLQYIAHEVLGEGKLELDGSINHIYKTNWNLFTEYNVQDVILPQKMEAKLKFIELAFIIANQTLIPIERVYSAIAIWDGFIMKELRQENKVMPNRIEPDDWYVREGHHIISPTNIVNLKEGSKYVEENYVKGGFVKATAGFYKWLNSRDFASLYPSNIMQFNISPETLVCLPTQEEIKEKRLIKSPMPGVYFLPHDTKLGVMTKIVTKIYNERVNFKKLMYEARDNGDTVKEAYYKSQQHIRKIMLNSLYGVSCNAGFHFFNLENARSITRIGRVLIRHVSQFIDNYFLSDDWNNEDRFEFYPNSNKDVIIKKPCVVLIDTDSNYIHMEPLMQQNDINADALNFCLDFNEKVLDPLVNVALEIFAEKYNVPQDYENNRGQNFELEKVIDKMLIQAKKKYLTSVKWNEGKIIEKPKVKATGIEIRKSNTPLFCKEYLEKVVDSIFEEKDSDEIIDEIIEYKKLYDISDVDKICAISSINKYNDYAKPTSHYIENGLSYIKRTPAAVRASINHNYLIKKNSWPMYEISKGMKPKYIYIKSRNILNQNIIGYIGNYPKEFKELFKIDYDLQFEKTFLSVVQRFYTAIGWGQISLKKTKINKFIN